MAEHAICGFFSVCNDSKLKHLWCTFRFKIIYNFQLPNKANREYYCYRLAAISLSIDAVRVRFNII